MADARALDAHYGRGDLENRILAALRELGKDQTRLTPGDLAPVDQFHIRGREATLELARLAAIERGERVLDVGGGISRHRRPRARLAAAGLAGVAWQDVTAPSIAWFRERLSQPPAPLGLHLLLVAEAPAMFRSILRNLEENRAIVAEGVFHR